MVEVKNMHFATSIAVLFALKEARGHTTLQETYSSIGKITDFEGMLELLRICYEKGEGKKVSFEEFIDILAQSGVGFVKVTTIFNQVVEGILYSGMSNDEVENAKKLVQSKLPQNQN